MRLCCRGARDCCDLRSSLLTWCAASTLQEACVSYEIAGCVWILKRLRQNIRQGLPVSSWQRDRVRRGALDDLDALHLFCRDSPVPCAINSCNGCDRFGVVCLHASLARCLLHLPPIGHVVVLTDRVANVLSRLCR